MMHDRQDRAPNPRRALTTALLLVCFSVVAPFLWGIAKRFDPRNAAKQPVDVIVAELAAVHPVTLCADGVGGHGISDDGPWYSAYLTVDKASNLDAAVTAGAKKAGFSLAFDHNMVKSLEYLQSDPQGSGLDPVEAYSAMHSGVAFDPTSSFFTGVRSEDRLRVFVIRQGQVTTRCRGDGWAKSMTVPPDKAIIRLSVTLPPVP